MSVIMLIVIMLSIIMLSGIMLSVIMPSVIMLNVMAPFPNSFFYFKPLCILPSEGVCQKNFDGCKLVCFLTFSLIHTSLTFGNKA